MSWLLAILLILAVAILIPGLLIEAAQFLVWIAIALVAVAVIVWAARMISGRKY